MCHFHVFLLIFPLLARTLSLSCWENIPFYDLKQITMKSPLCLLSCLSIFFTPLTQGQVSTAPYSVPQYMASAYPSSPTHMPHASHHTPLDCSIFFVCISLLGLP
jgi:hypothetical protein